MYNSCRAVVRIDRLEARVLFAVPAELVADLNPGTLAGYGGFLTDTGGGVVVFVGDDGTSGLEPWTLDLSESGRPTLVEDINPNGSSAPGPLVHAEENLFFAANDGTRGRELWVLNDDEGTLDLVKDLATGLPDSNPDSILKASDVAFFSTSIDGDVAMYRTDGTTVRKVKLPPGDVGPSPAAFVEGQTFFRFGAGSITNPNDDNIELWSVNKSGKGAGEVEDLAEGFSSFPANLVGTSDLLYFTAYAGKDFDSATRQLFVYDVAEEDMQKLKNLNLLGADDIDGAVAVGNRLYFAIARPGGAQELWTSDGTPEGTERVKIVSRDATGSIGSLTAVGNRLFFVAGDADSGRELWTSNGTAKGTVQVKDINPGAASSLPTGLTDVGGTLYFAASDGTTGEELWKSDGTAAGTELVSDVEPGPVGSAPRDMIRAAGEIVFAATTSEAGRELYTLAQPSTPGPLAIQATADRATLNEGETVQFNATVTRGTAESFRWDLDGDGDFETTGQSPSFRYADNRLNNAPYLVRVRATAANGDEARDRIRITVRNTPPRNVTIAVKPESATAVPGELMLFDAVFQDGNPDDGHGFSWDHGDNQSAPGFSDASADINRFTAPGTYTVKLTVRDKDGATATGETPVRITSTVMSPSGVLSVGGTPRTDTIRVMPAPDTGEHRSGRTGAANGDVLQSVRVQVNGKPARVFTASKIAVFGGAGNDDIHIAKGLFIGTRLVGGAGADTLTGGGGDDILVGGRGADRLKGGDGLDALKGGKGKDNLVDDDNAPSATADDDFDDDDDHADEDDHDDGFHLSIMTNTIDWPSARVRTHFNRSLGMPSSMLFPMEDDDILLGDSLTIGLRFGMEG